MSNGRATIVLLTVGYIKNILLYKINYFPEPHTNKNKIEIELDLSNYATKSDLKKRNTCRYLKKMI